MTLHAVSGKRAHDARFVAAMNVHGLSQLITFNVSDFSRYTTVTALSPDQIIQTTP